MMDSQQQRQKASRKGPIPISEQPLSQAICGIWISEGSSKQGGISPSFEASVSLLPGEPPFPLQQDKSKANPSSRLWWQLFPPSFRPKPSCCYQVQSDPGFPPPPSIYRIPWDGICAIWDKAHFFGALLSSGWKLRSIPVCDRMSRGSPLIFLSLLLLCHTLTFTFMGE